MGKTREFSANEASSSKHSYIKFQEVSDGSASYANLPNLKRIRKLIIARKRLRLKYKSIAERHASDPRQKFWFFDYSTKRRRLTAKAIKNGTHSGSEGGSVPKKSKDEVENPDVKKTEDYQRRTWKARIIRDAYRPEVLQVIRNKPLFDQTRDDRKNSLTVLMEIMRAGIYHHNWALVSKCAEGLALQFKRNSRTCHWILWNGGFLALVNLLPAEIDRVTEFAIQARTALRSYPRRLGIEVATWLTQQGYFLRAINLLQDWHDKWGKAPVFSRKRCLGNPKRYQVELVTSVLTGFQSYINWQRDSNKLKCGRFTGSQIAVRRAGEFALHQFEEALNYAYKCDADVTIFIMPLIELTMEFRTEFAARELFLSLVRRHENNFILEALYLEFIEKYFDFLEDEIRDFQERQRLYRTPKKKSDNRLHLFKLRNWKKRLCAEADNVVVFHPVQNPTYKF